MFNSEFYLNSLKVRVRLLYGICLETSELSKDFRGKLHQNALRFVEMTLHQLPNDRFISLLQERRRRRATVLSSVFREPQPSSFQTEFSPPSNVSKKVSPRFPSENEANLSTHYLFSSSRPQNEIQNPYPNCFEGYPKLQRCHSSFHLKC